MTKDTIPEALRRQQALVRQLEPLSVRLERLAAQRVIQPIVFDPRRELARSLHSAIEDVQRSVALDSRRALVAPLENIRLLGAELHKQFHLPKPVEFAQLVQSIEMDAASRPRALRRELEASLANTVKAMSTPWLNNQHEIRSLTGMAGLNELGQILQTAKSFEITPTKHVRSLLGDWRRKIDWPPEIFTDPFARSDFYLDLGLEPALTEFPAEAFHEALALTGIEGCPAPLTDAYNRAQDSQQDEEQTGFERNNAAHELLQRLETRMRNFITEQMKRTFGENWVEDGVPTKMREQWERKRKRACQNDERPQPLIAYADFTDYKRIIEDENNWHVFEPFFRRKTSVQESLQRLHPIRVCTMHARFITQDDELYLLAETQRLSRAMDQSGSPEGRATQAD